VWCQIASIFVQKFGMLVGDYKMLWITDVLPQGAQITCGDPYENAAKKTRRRLI
jgi:hypothetical protein